MHTLRVWPLLAAVMVAVMVAAVGGVLVASREVIVGVLVLASGAVLIALVILAYGLALRGRMRPDSRYLDAWTHRAAHQIAIGSQVLVAGIVIALIVVAITRR